MWEGCVRTQDIKGWANNDNLLKFFCSLMSDLVMNFNADLKIFEFIFFRYATKDFLIEKIR